MQCFPDTRWFGQRLTKTRCLCLIIRICCFWVWMFLVCGCRFQVSHCLPQFLKASNLRVWKRPLDPCALVTTNRKVRGVLRVTSGYAGGSEAGPTHEQVWRRRIFGFSGALLEGVHHVPWCAVSLPCSHKGRRGRGEEHRGSPQFGIGLTSGSPSALQVSLGDTGHAEVVLVQYDADVVSYEDLLKVRPG